MEILNTVFLPLCRTTFDMAHANAYYKNSLELLNGLDVQVTAPSEPLTSPEILGAYLKSIKASLPDAAIVQTTTFVDSTFLASIAQELSCPIILWGVREPVIDGGKLRLNSLTGVYAAGNVLMSLGRKFSFVFGSPQEESLRTVLAAELKALQVKKQLHDLKVGVVGHFPPGFYFSNLEDVDLMRHIGPKLLRLEAREVIKKAGLLTADEIKPALLELQQNMTKTDCIDDKTLEQYSRIRTAYKQIVEENGIGALATRCWPDFFMECQAAVCTAISFLTENGIVSSCEADIGGAISMFIAQNFAGSAPYFGDPVSLDEEKNSVIYWHCGAGACSLARKDTGAAAGTHPNRKLGVTMEFGLKEGRVTILRLGKGPNGYRMFLAGGEALDEPQKFLGTSVEIKTDNSAKELITASVEQGWEAHFVVAYGDIRPQIKALCKWMDIPVSEF